MSELTDLLLRSTDPVSAVLLMVVVFYVRRIERSIRRDLAEVKRRTRRLEDRYLSADGSGD